MTIKTDTSPARLRELAERLWITATSDDRVAAHHLLLAMADEKEADEKCKVAMPDDHKIKLKVPNSAFKSVELPPKP